MWFYTFLDGCQQIRFGYWGSGLCQGFVQGDAIDCHGCKYSCIYYTVYVFEKYLVLFLNSLQMYYFFKPNMRLRFKFFWDISLPNSAMFLRFAEIIRQVIFPRFLYGFAEICESLLPKKQFRAKYFNNF